MVSHMCVYWCDIELQMVVHFRSISFVVNFSRRSAFYVVEFNLLIAGHRRSTPTVVIVVFGRRRRHVVDLLVRFNVMASEYQWRLLLS